MFWNLAIVRGTYGFIGVFMSVYILFTVDFEANNIATYTTRESTFLLISHLGFFIFEWSAQILFDIKYKTFSSALHVHHLIAFAGYFMVIQSKTNHFLAALGFLLEGSTPFSCICYCLIKAGMEKTLLWKTNQILLVHIFHVRSVLECTMFYKLIVNWTKFQQIPPLVFWHSFFGTLIVMIFLTPLWTHRKTKQLFNPSDWNTPDANAKHKSKTN